MLPDKLNYTTPNSDCNSTSPPRFDSMNLLQTVQRMMVAQFDLNIEELTPETKLDNLGIDSLSVIEFMFTLEDEFKIKLPDERVELKTVGDVVNILHKIVSSNMEFA